MAALPAARLAIGQRPFRHVGLDYFGPLEITRGRTVEKRWVALFTCLTVRAIYMDLADSLSTSAAIMCIRNFIATRGLPDTIYCDNGTNFRGASTVLVKQLETIKKEDLETSFDTIKWSFNPPAAPHMGGSWERLVRTVKSILTEILHCRRPHEKVLFCALKEAERIVNSRPLTYMPVEVGCPESLTPYHFLLGSANGAGSPGVFSETDALQSKDWKYAQVLADNFWLRFVREYVPTLTRRTKWFKPTVSVNVGDIGVIWDERERGSWRKCIVVDTIKSKQDGVVRQIVVKAQNRMYTRPVVKFAKLDVRLPEPTSEGMPVEALHPGEDVRRRTVATM